MAKAKLKVDMDHVRKDCFGFREEADGKPAWCSALEDLYCGAQLGECSFFKKKGMVPMRGTAKTCEYCGKLFIPSKYSKEPKYCSKECGYKGRYIKKHRRTTPGTEVDYGIARY